MLVPRAVCPCHLRLPLYTQCAYVWNVNQSIGSTLLSVPWLLLNWARTSTPYVTIFFSLSSLMRVTINHFHNKTTSNKFHLNFNLTRCVLVWRIQIFRLSLSLLNFRFFSFFTLFRTSYIADGDKVKKIDIDTGIWKTRNISFYFMIDGDRRSRFCLL